MNSDPGNLKAALRVTVRTRLAGVPLPIRAVAGAAICAHLRESKLWQTAKSVLLFAPLPDEPDVWPLLAEALAEQKLVGLPQYSAADSRYGAAQIRNPEGDLCVGRFQIREPAPGCAALPLTGLDLILVPGVAFDRRGRRLGRGRGFYDRLLKEATAAKFCGVGFEEQILETMPAAAHDVAMHYLVSPRGMVACGN